MTDVGMPRKMVKDVCLNQLQVSNECLGRGVSDVCFFTTVVHQSDNFSSNFHANR